MSVITKSAVLTSKDAEGNSVIYAPFTIADNVEGAVKSINNQFPNASGNVTLPIPDTSGLVQQTTFNRVSKVNTFTDVPDISDTTDYNNFKTNGLYFFTSDNAPTTNAPSDVPIGMGFLRVWTIPTSAGVGCWQILTILVDFNLQLPPTMYTRSYRQTSVDGPLTDYWSAWTKINTTDAGSGSSTVVG